jgi:hypothetical protein
MEKEKILYSITIEDVINVSKEIGIDFSEDDLRIIEDKIDDYMGSTWHDAIENALTELKNNNKSS